MKRFFYVLVFAFLSFFFISNSAQPGVWNAGGSSSFTLLYPEDSIAFKKIQMKSENIYMQLYKGFAVVKGDYYFKNTIEDSLKIKVGYPINNVFQNRVTRSYVNEVYIDDLYQIRGLVNNKEIPIYKEPNFENENWYVWNITFPPNKIIKFTVYFLVNTNNAKILEGYNSDDRNAFIYLIETGSIWKSPIETGNFYTQLQNDMTIDDVKAIAPSTLTFNDRAKVFHFSMNDYGKIPDDNFIVTYNERLENFNFEKITQKSNTYFKTIDTFSKENFSEYIFEEITLLNPYKTFGSANTAINLIFYFIFYGVPVLVLILVIIVLTFQYKKFIHKKNRLKK